MGFHSNRAGNFYRAKGEDGQLQCNYHAAGRLQPGSGAYVHWRSNAGNVPADDSRDAGRWSHPGDISGDGLDDWFDVGASEHANATDVDPANRATAASSILVVLPLHYPPAAHTAENGNRDRHPAGSCWLQRIQEGYNYQSNDHRVIRRLEQDGSSGSDCKLSSRDFSPE